MRDFTDTQNPRGWFLLEKEGRAKPDYVSQQDFPTEEELTKLASVGFACPKNRKFPVHTKQATWLSAAFLYGEPEASAHVLENIKAAAAVHGIADDILPLLVKHDTLQKEAAEHFAISDKELQLYPTGTRFDVEHSGYGLLEDIRNKRIPIKEARRAALALVKRASEISAHIPPAIAELGANTFVTEASLRSQADWRSKMASGRDEGLYGVAVDTWMASDQSEECRGVCAQAWEDLDATLGIKTSAFTPDVATVWFKGVPVQQLRKAAQAYVFIDGEPYAAGMITSVPKETITSWFAGEAAEKVARVLQLMDSDTLAASEEIEKLPGEIKTAFCNRLAAHHAR